MRSTRRRRGVRGRRFAVGLAAVALLAAGCLEDAPTSTKAPITPPATSAPTSTAEPLRAEATERHARDVTLRVRNLGCGGIATGSAVAIGEGLLVTNRHVIEGADRLEVTTWDGRTLTVDVAQAAMTHDIAVAAVDGVLPDAARVAADDPAVGAEVLVAGYPGGGALRIDEGSVVDHTDDVLFGAEAGALELDVGVAPGSSGGPVLDPSGAVVGVIYALAAPSGHGLAVPVSALREALDAGDALVGIPDCPTSP